MPFRSNKYWEHLEKTVPGYKRPPRMWRWFWLPLREYVWYPIKRWWYFYGTKP